MSRKALILPVFSAVIFAACSLVSAQVDYATATLRGTIFDQQRLVVADANVTVSSVSQGWSRTLHTGSDGAYRVASLLPGTYTVQVQARGFATAVATVTVSVGDMVTYDVHLRVGLATESIEVTEPAPLISSEQTQEANTIDRRHAADLPSLSHVFTDFIFTLPGVSSSDAPRAQMPGFSAFLTTGFSVGGSNGRHNLVTIDGGENGIGSGQLRTPKVPIDSVQEFQVNRSSFAAEFGYTAGSAVNIVTRSGSNRWHGSAHGFFRNEHLDAGNYFAAKSGSKAFEQDVATGAAMGGPILKNKIFVFSAFEYDKGDAPQFRSYATSTAAMGIRSNVAQQNYVSLLAQSGNPVLRSTAAQLQFLLDPGNFPNAAKLLLPNTGVFNDWSKSYTWVTRFDYEPAGSNSLMLRLSVMKSDASQMHVLDPANAPDDAILGHSKDYTLLGAWTHVFSPRMLNQLRLQVVPSSTVDAPPVSLHTAYVRIAGLGQFGGEHYEPFYMRQRRFQFEDSLTLDKGKHTFKFGASYRPFTYVLRNELFFGGEFQFWDGAVPIVGGLIQPSSPAFSALAAFNIAHGWPASGDPATYLTAMETFAVGIPVSYRQGFGNPQMTSWEHHFGAYAQDSWRLSQSLTVNYGGRLDFYAPTSPVPANSYFSPRLGFAWSPGGKGKTVIRGGGGLFVAPVPIFVGYVKTLFSDSGQYINQVATSLTSKNQRITSLWTILTGCDPARPYVCTKQPPFPQLHETDLATVGMQVGPGQKGRVVGDVMQPYKNNYTVQASLAVERQLGANMALTAAYQMYHGVHLQVPLDTNLTETGVVDPFAGPIYTPIDPNLAQRNTASAIGSSIYHGMLVSLSRRFARGFQFQTNYTFSKTIDDSTDFNSEFRVFRPTRPYLDRSLSAFDIRHNFVAHAIYTTPFRPGRGFLSHVFGDVTVSPVVFLRSGIPFTVRVPGIQNGTPGGSLYARPWHAGRNTGIGPNFYALDMRLAKSFFFDRDAGRKVEFIVQGANILNHTNFSAVNDSFPANPNPFQVAGENIDLLNGPYRFHGIRGLDASQPLAFKAAFDPRQLQFGVKLFF